MRNWIIGFSLLLALFAALPASAQTVRGLSVCTGNPPAALSVSNSSSNVQLKTCGPTVILYNITSTEAFYLLGATAPTATSSANSLPGNTYVVLNVPIEAAGWFLAAITAAGTTTIRIVQGY